MAMRSAARSQHSVAGLWLRQGIIGGIVAGIVFALFEMVMAGLQMGVDAFFMPLRMIGGMALGEQALDPATSILLAGGAGVVIHMMLSAVFGAAVALGALAIPAIRQSAVPLVAWSSLAGFALWIVNFFVIAPSAGWRWFPEDTDPLVQFVAHTFVFGSVLGFYLERSARRRRA